MSSQFEVDDIIDLTNTQTYTSRVIFSNSVICIDSDDSFTSSPVTQRVSKKSTLDRKTGSENLQKVNDQSQKLNKSKESKNRLGECPICWDELGTKPLASTLCGHVYCIECLKKSLCVEKRCPMCRTMLKGKLAYHPLYLGR